MYMTYGCIAQVAIPTNWTRHRRPFAVVVVVVVVVVIVVKRHERLEHEGCIVVMAISCESHLRAWLLEEVETLLVNQSEHTLHWAADLFGGLLRGLSLKELLLEASCILPSGTLQLFIAFSLHQHPREVTAALVEIVQQHAAAQTELLGDAASQ